MSVWEAAKVRGDTPGSRIDIDSGGSSFVRVLTPAHRLNDGNDYTYVGWSNDLIFNGVEEAGGGSDVGAIYGLAGSFGSWS